MRAGPRYVGRRSTQCSPAAVVAGLVLGVVLGTCGHLLIHSVALHHAAAPAVATSDSGPGDVATRAAPCDCNHTQPAAPAAVKDLSAADVTTQLRHRFARLPALDAIPPGSDVFLTFSNGHYTALMLNAAALVADLGLPVVVLAFDTAAADACKEHGLPFVWSAVRMDTADFRQDRSQFLLLGAQKATAVLDLLDNLQARTVALVDTDTIWLRNPFPWLAQHPDADLFATTDCLSHVAEVHKQTVPRCGHVPGGRGGGWAINTGITVWRNTPGARSFARMWHDMMSDNSLHERGFDDQYSFNRLATSEIDAVGALHSKAFPLQRVQTDERVFWAAPNDTMRLMVLPSALFAGGKTMFFSHLPTKYGLHPYVVHATFQRYNNHGKVSRFREAHAYLLDPPEYYREGDFLAYDNMVLDYIAALDSMTGGALTLVYKHALAATYQLHVFRDAAAMAIALNRTLILPKIWAWCDSDHAPTIMASCSMEGAEHAAPWHAPGDLLFNMDVLGTTDFLRWREHSFLDNPRTPKQVVWSQTSAWRLFDSEAVPDSYATGPYIRTVDEEGLLRAVQGLHARVLRVQNLQPGTFQRFSEPARDQAFNEWFRRMMSDLKWCCTTQLADLKERRYDSIDFPAPPPLPPVGSFRVDATGVPAYCSDDAVMQRLRTEATQPLRYPNHPCNFLASAPRLPEWGSELWQLMRLHGGTQRG